MQAGLRRRGSCSGEGLFKGSGGSLNPWEDCQVSHFFSWGLLTAKWCPRATWAPSIRRKGGGVRSPTSASASSKFGEQHFRFTFTYFNSSDRGNRRTRLSLSLAFAFARTLSTFALIRIVFHRLTPLARAPVRTLASPVVRGFTDMTQFIRITPLSFLLINFFLFFSREVRIRLTFRSPGDTGIRTRISRLSQRFWLRARKARLDRGGTFSSVRTRLSLFSFTFRAAEIPLGLPV